MRAADAASPRVLAVEVFRGLRSCLRTNFSAGTHLDIRRGTSRRFRHG
jgi:hypothetical protein